MIKDIILSEFYNSCKDKTIKVSIRNQKGTFSASAPSGTSKGAYEAKTIEIEKIKKLFPKIKKKLIGKEEREVDKIVEKIGSNLSLPISIAAVRAITNNNPYKLFNPFANLFPFLLGNTIGGGAHSGYLSEQELLVIPLKAKTIKEAIKTNLSIWKEIGELLGPFITGRNRENAWICTINDLKCLEMLSDKASDFGARIGIDFAANNIYNKGRYYYKHPDRNFTPDKQLEFVLDLIKSYKLAYVEDPFIENDFDNFSELTKKANCLITGDDLFATQSNRLKKGIKKKACNAIIIKPNQAGTVYKTMETVNLAKIAGYATIVSHRSCETDDSFIADLAVGTSSPVIKCGIFGKEREAKFKRLEELWNKIEKPKMTKIFI